MAKMIYIVMNISMNVKKDHFRETPTQPFSEPRPRR